MQRLFAHFRNVELTTEADLLAAGGAWLTSEFGWGTGRDPVLHFAPQTPGPHGADGTLCWLVESSDIEGTMRPPAIAPDRQTWIPVSDDSASPCVGWENAFPPEPNLLRRFRQVDGVACRLSNEAWLLPRLDVLPFKHAKGSAYLPPTAEPPAADVAANEMCLEVRVQMPSPVELLQSHAFPPRTIELLELAIGRNYRGCPALWRELRLWEDADMVAAAVVAVTGVAAKFIERAIRKTAVR